MKKLILFLAVLLLTGCDESMQANKGLYSELVLNGDITIDYNDWFNSKKGKVLRTMSVEARRELTRDIKAKRLGITKEELKKQEEIEKKAPEEKVVEAIKKKNPARIKWSNNSRQGTW